MSELINNREQLGSNQNMKRQEMLKSVFWDIYNRKTVDEVKAFVDEKLGKVTIDEIAKLSQYQREMIEEKDLSKSEVERISAAHLTIMEGKILDVQHPQDIPGHPIHTFRRENREIEGLLQSKLIPRIKEFEKEDSPANIYKLIDDCNLLYDMDKHFTRKEQLLFPYLEKYGINGPSVNMWRLDDYIRDSIKDAKKLLPNYNGDKEPVLSTLHYVVEQVTAMIYREEHILFPMSLSNLTEDDWIKIAHESDEIGYCLTEPAAVWKPESLDINGNTFREGYIKLETGVFSIKQLELILNHLPVDITFIGHKDIVRYFSHGKERIFARTKAVIGRTVQNCHPPKSAHIVEALLDDFKAGKKDCEDFWIKFKDKYVYIRYFAVRNEQNEYMGTLEFTQDIDPIQAIEGEKRILSL
ncbi:hypothetical protein SAMN05421743_11075 [Thalassobacillus cyri]|uniref:Hemerythrin-like domain-containing protein n=1 Tax=Thalassobacillus cyri TaxID=571932 RepID=A0A1H4F108_9BACI|nr:DUF438 domain-containing protein [Thalassobacillus cyri]SEA90986.1 hypothetical protein SAMN05421743_11075 [Thalassobacillus cyri]